MVQCSKTNQKRSHHDVIDTTVTPREETAPVPSKAGEDAADDPAIWIHPEDVMKSEIIGTNKTDGLAVYNLDGEEIYYYSIGRINNVDVSYDFPLDGKKVDIAAGTNRTDNTISLFRIDKKTGELSNIAAEKLISGVDEVYGVAMYTRQVDGKQYVFVNGKGGLVEQWELKATDTCTITATVVREFRIESQPEGMVADDENGILYVGEENNCIWKYGAEPEDGAEATKIRMSDTSNPNINYDIEGLTLYYASGGEGYLIASIQGNYSYAVFEREGNNEYITSFRIKETDAIDGVEETDGIDAINVSFGDKYPYGLFVVQDGFNYDGDSLRNQNFKIIDWKSVARLVDPPLIIDTTYRVN